MSQSLTLFTAAVVLTAISGLTPSAALAQDGGHSSNHIDSVRFDAHVSFGGYGSLGAGFRAEIPLLSKGFLDNVDDELALSFGADAFFLNNFFPDRYAGGVYVVPSVVLQWNFYIDDKWSLFPEAGVAFYVGDSRFMRRDASFYAAPAFGLGLRYHFSQRNALLFRVATPTGFQIGLTF